MCNLRCNYRQLRILLHALTNLHYKDAQVDGQKIGDFEWGDLMDLVAAELGKELRKRELASSAVVNTLLPVVDRRVLDFNPGEILQYPGPDRRDMRAKAINKGLHDVHMQGSEWVAVDNDGKKYHYNMGEWTLNGG
jgi:hypothetical protein